MLHTSPSIALVNLGWSAPDGTAVLAGLTTTFARERTGIVGRNGSGKTTLLRLLSGDLRPSSGTIAINGTIATLHQAVQVQQGTTVADLLGVGAALDLLDKATAGTASLDEIGEADWTLEPRIAQALADVGLAVEPSAPLSSLSGGQRTRAALTGAVLAQPDFLLLDEPTNNLDRDGRRAVGELLAGWRSGAIVVSHDRELLEVMDAIVEFTSLGAQRYGGNWSAYRARKEVELAVAEQDLAAAQRHASETARKAQVAVERKQRRDAAGARKAMRGDMPRILIGARRNRAEQTTGGNARLAERMRGDAAADLNTARAKVERLEPITVQLASTGLTATRRVLDIDRLTFGFEAGRPLLKDVSFSLTGPERVAVVGANGSGKSTLLNIVAGRLSPWSGSACLHVPFAYCDQGVGMLDPRLTVAENFLHINPEVDLNTCQAALARFRFRADAAHRPASELSGGQQLRAALACSLGSPRPPLLLILDEPTNHLDIEAVEAVEAGLRAFDGALLVVSHDTRFLDRIAVSRTIELGA